MLFIITYCIEEKKLFFGSNNLLTLRNCYRYYQSNEKLKVPVSTASPEVQQYIKEWKVKNPEFVAEWRSKLKRHFNRDMDLLAIQEKQQKIMDIVEIKTKEKFDALAYLEENILGDVDLKAELDAKLSETHALYEDTLKKAEVVSVCMYYLCGYICIYL